MNMLIGMTTADRSPRRNYVAQTLLQLWKQGVPPYRIHVFASSPDVAWFHRLIDEQCMLTVAEMCTLHVPATVLTRNQNGLALLQGMPKCDWVLHLEDDLTLCKDFLGSVERWILKHHCDRRVYSFCTFKGEPTTESFDCPRTSYGCLAVAMRWKHMRDFAEHVKRELPNWRRSMTDGWRKSGFDMMMRKWAREPFLCSNPCFVQHEGGESLTHSFRNRPFWRTRRFAGVDWAYE